MLNLFLAFTLTLRIGHDWRTTTNFGKLFYLTLIAVNIYTAFKCWKLAVRFRTASFFTYLYFIKRKIPIL